jgi:ketosteroid isomerase-like protein
MTKFSLPEPVAAYIAATNAFDLEAMMATFAEHALVNDHREEFDGPAAIRDWASREIVGDRVTLEVAAAATRGMTAQVTAIVGGDFDKAGLPDPLMLTFYFAVSDGKIDQLVIVHNKRAATSASAPQGAA